MGDRSKNFSNHEFVCNCRERAPHLPPCESILPPDDLIVILQDVRDHFGLPVTINSGHHCPPYNDLKDGKSASLHLDAKAADIGIKGVSANRVQKYLLGKYPNEHGIGRYNTFTHIDTRGYKARWDNRR